MCLLFFTSSHSPVFSSAISLRMRTRSFRRHASTYPLVKRHVSLCPGGGLGCRITHSDGRCASCLRSSHSPWSSGSLPSSPQNMAARFILRRRRSNAQSRAACSRSRSAGWSAVVLAAGDALCGALDNWIGSAILARGRFLQRIRTKNWRCKERE